MSIDPSQIPSYYPAAAPPEGVVPNFVNPPSTGHILVSVSSLLLALMWILVGSRTYVKAKINNKFTLDDYTCAAASVFVTAYYVITVYASLYCKIGVDMWNVTFGELLAKNCVKDVYFSSILAPPTLALIKVTFFIFYQHLFRPIRPLRYVNWAGIIVTLTGYLAFFIVFLVLCTPRTGETWQAAYLGPRQTEAGKVSIPLPAFGLALDLVILIIPLYGVWTLQLNTKKKLGVAAIFMTGIIAIIASILSITVRQDMQRDTRGNVTKHLMAANLTTNVEMTLGVCITCMPTFSHMLRTTMPLFSQLRSTLGSWTGASRSNLGNSKHSGRYGRHQDSRTASESNASGQYVTTWVGKGDAASVEMRDGVQVRSEVTQEWKTSTERLARPQGAFQQYDSRKPASARSIV